MKTLRLISLLSIAMFLGINAQNPVNIEMAYVGDMVGLPANAYNQTSYLGMVDLCLGLDTKLAGLWSNGEFFLQIENTHGSTPSAADVCDMQCFSNIENGNYTYLYQLWFKQQINKFSILVGMHDLNSEFLASDYAGEYINSSFGIMPVVSLNVPVSIFPKNSLGYVVGYHLSPKSFLQLGFYDGDPSDLSQDPYGIKWSVGNNEGVFSIGEYHLNFTDDDAKPSLYKMGLFYHSGNFTDLNNTEQSIKGNYGLYCMADQYLLQLNNEKQSKLGLFAQLGFAPSDRNVLDYSYAIGFNLSELFAKHKQDVLGLALTTAHRSSNFSADSEYEMATYETTIECMYKTKVTNHFVIQPEFQYIVNPGAVNTDNIFLGLIRSYITF